MSAGLCLAAPVPVTVDREQGMRRGGELIFVQGVGGDSHLDRLAARGANSIRTWSTNGLEAILDDAQKHQLTVSAGVWLEPECAWFSYASAEQCAKQTVRVKAEIEKYRDHPALLAWGLGNEMEGDGTNAHYWRQLERLALMVKEVDPAHPTFTAVAGLSAPKADGLNSFAPHLDYVGINTYGGLFGLRKHLAAVKWTRPWMVTEWGPQGFWERPRSKSGVPLEQTSTQKAAMMQRGYREVIELRDGCLGSYAFVWHAKYEATVTWFGLLTDAGDTTESVDVLQECWTGRKPENLAPRVQAITGVPADAIATGEEFHAQCLATDAEGDVLAWRWAVLPELAARGASGKAKAPKPVAAAITSTTGDGVTVHAPAKAGVYRLHVWVTDGHGHAATANAPFEVR